MYNAKVNNILWYLRGFVLGGFPSWGEKSTSKKYRFQMKGVKVKNGQIKDRHWKIGSTVKKIFLPRFFPPLKKNEPVKYRYLKCTVSICT